MTGTGTGTGTQTQTWTTGVTTITLLVLRTGELKKRLIPVDLQVYTKCLEAISAVTVSPIHPLSVSPTIIIKTYRQGC